MRRLTRRLIRAAGGGAGLHHGDGSRSAERAPDTVGMSSARLARIDAMIEAEVPPGNCRGWYCRRSTREGRLSEGDRRRQPRDARAAASRRTVPPMLDDEAGCQRRSPHAVRTRQIPAHRSVGPLPAAIREPEGLQGRRRGRQADPRRAVAQADDSGCVPPHARTGIGARPKPGRRGVPRGRNLHGRTRFARAGDRQARDGAAAL